jgi:hypothetical protein
MMPISCIATIYHSYYIITITVEFPLKNGRSLHSSTYSAPVRTELHGVRAESVLFRVIPHGLAGGQLGLDSYVTVRADSAESEQLRLGPLGHPSDQSEQILICSD